jgi:flagellar protein FlaI
MDYKVLEAYDLVVNNIVIRVSILSIENETVPLYTITITNISETTKIILEKIREEFISSASKDLEEFDEDVTKIQQQFRQKILGLLRKYFPTADPNTMDMLLNYMLQQNIGLGNLEILLKDGNLEEIVVNNAQEPVWVYHRRRGWCKTNIKLPDEARIWHYSTIIGRDVGKEITTLNPLMDAHLKSGDRVNATLSPISTRGHTITIRKFATKPWTMTDFLKDNVLSYEAAALLWMAAQNEMSMLIAGGTGSGKTSMLNTVANFLPPNQRVISIEDTREIVLPELLHWVPMETRLANPEGKGGITMLDLIVNSLRMRPDRIIVGEIRRREEAEVLFEAMRTGHSVYATLHANNVRETINRLTTRPMDIPKETLAAISLIVVQNLNRRTGRRQTLQVAEILPSGEYNIIMQLNPLKGTLDYIAEPLHFFNIISLYTGMAKQDILQDLRNKVKVLEWMVSKNIADVNKIGLIMSKYYQNKPFQHIL